MDLAPDFDKFCALLIDEHVEFVIVDAYAQAFHGAPRALQVTTTATLG